MNRLLGVRPEDGRVVWMAFATLLTIVAAHAVLETARDALFLADLPATRLPWAYLGIAALAFVLTRAAARLVRSSPRCSSPAPREPPLSGGSSRCRRLSR
jgi:hypothetical protein